MNMLLKNIIKFANSEEEDEKIIEVLWFLNNLFDLWKLKNILVVQSLRPFLELFGAFYERFFYEKCPPLSSFPRWKKNFFCGFSYTRKQYSF